MGWKALQEHFGIKHIVQITDEGVCIGSPYIHNIIVIGPDGKCVKRYDDKWAANDDLTRYQRELDADPELIKRLLDTPDTFERSLLVYIYDGGDIVEKNCE